MFEILIIGFHYASNCSINKFTLHIIHFNGLSHSQRICKQLSKHGIKIRTQKFGFFFFFFAYLNEMASWYSPQGTKLYLYKLFTLKYRILNIGLADMLNYVTIYISFFSPLGPILKRCIHRKYSRSTKCILY